jgi:uncharacterized protein (UPF0147 family)
MKTIPWGGEIYVRAADVAARLDEITDQHNDRHAVYDIYDFTTELENLDDE